MAFLTLAMPEDRNRVTVSAENGLTLNVSNDSGQEVVFERDVSPVTGLYDGIYLTFQQGEGAGDLQADISHIGLGIDGIQGWSCQICSPNGIPFSGSSPFWCIRPAAGMKVEPGTSFTINISNIQCNSVTGTTPVKISQQSQGETEKAALDIIKCSMAAVDKFEINSRDYNIGDRVTFQWALHGTDGYSKVYLDGALQTGGSCDQQIHNRAYSLTVENGSSYIVKSTFTPSLVFFESFEITGGDGAKKTLTVAWKTRNLKDCYLQYEGTKEAVNIAGGSKTVSIADKGESLEIQLLMTEGETGAEIPVQKCVYQFPEVITFQAYYTTELIPVEAIGQMEIIPADYIPYGPPDPPPPPPPPVVRNVHISWKSSNAIRCELAGVPGVKAVEGAVDVQLTYVPRGPLNAIDKYGFVRGKMNEKG